MNGELKKLNPNAYNPSYDVQALSSYDIEKLDLIKLEIESELHLLARKLESNKVTMDSSLLSEDGFPRSDIDVVEVRTARVKIIKLRNDLKAVIDELATKLSSVLQTPTPVSSTTPSMSLSSSAMKHVPFATVSEVVSGGPAEKSGLTIGDKICLFGELNATNHNNLQRLAQLVRSSENESIRLLITREGRHEELVLVPTSNWHGQGLLGCRFTQI